MNAQLNAKPSHTMRKIMLAGSIALVLAIAGCSSNKKALRLRPIKAPAMPRKKL